MNKNSYELSNGKIVVKPKNKNIIYFLTFLLVLILSLYITNFDLSMLIKNFNRFLNIIQEMFIPIGDPEAMKEYFAYTSVVLPQLLITLQMAIVGTVIGALLSFPAAVFASVNVSNKYVSICTKVVLSLTRTLPVLIYAMILAYVFGLGSFAGTVAIAIFTFGIISKMFYEIIERVDIGAYEAAISSGVSTYNAFNITIKPQIMAAFYSISLYTFEINVRSAAIIGYVGAGGIGQQLNDAMALRQYSHAGLIILYTILLVIIIDLVTQFVRKEMI